MGILFKVVYLPENQGHGNARRISLEKCENELVALMDADDISYPNRFEKQLTVFGENKTVDIVGGQITEFIGEPGNIIGKRLVPLEDKEIKKYMKKRCPMNQVSVMFRKSFYERVGGYIDWYCEEDYYLWIRMALSDGKFANVEDDLVNVRIGDEMSSRRGGTKYFLSEVRIQNLMLKKKIISLPRYIFNILIRFGGEIVLTDRLRTLLFKKIRKPVNINEANVNQDNSIKVHSKTYEPFSVAMCVYGGDNPKYFDNALKSIINQSVKPSEIILVVDGPVPESILKVIKKYEILCEQ